jgi:N-carbamoylputrescine amidase
MTREPDLILATDPPASPLRTERSDRPALRVGAVQEAWHPDPAEHAAALARGIRLAAEHGAQLICLQELTLSPYFAITPDAGSEASESLEDGPTITFARAMAGDTGAFIHASLFEAAETAEPGRASGYNTAICIAPDGRLVARTRKLHIPRFDGYHEDAYFRPGDTGYPIHHIAGAKVALPTCWDQWFPELARTYGLLGAELIVYPTAIGSEPQAPEFDTQPIWQQVIIAHGITSATFMLAINRIGTEGPITFYGSSFISDPYGRLLAKAPRDRPAVLVADLDLDQRQDWLKFGLLDTRRPDTYQSLVA